MSSAGPMAQDAAEREVPFLIVGAGAAGLQLAYFLQRSGTPHLVLEAEAKVGAFWQRYPRSGRLISFNRVHSIYDDPEIRLRWDWNSLLTEGYEALFCDYSTSLYPHVSEMSRYLRDFARRYELNVRFSSRVTRISRREDGTFTVEVEDGAVLTCRYLVVASGMGNPYRPPIPGIEHAEGYESIDLDAREFTGQRVLILGKGNSAFEVADAILDTAAIVHMVSPHSVRFAWATRHPGHVRGHYTRILDSYQLKLLNGLLDAEVIEIVPRQGRFDVSVAYVHADDERETLCYDRVVRCTGFRFDTGMFDESCRPLFDHTGRLPAMTSDWQSVNVPNLFFAGTLMQARDFMRASSAFVDGFRYNVRTLHALLLARWSGRPLPATRLDSTPAALAEATIARVSRSSGLWAQFGFLADVLVVEDGHALHYQELPRDYVFDSDLGSRDHYYTITFEWGTWQGDVFAIDRHPDHRTAYTNVFLHPIVRRYRGRHLVEEHHVLEDLLGMYSWEGESGFALQRSRRDMKRYHKEEHDLPLRAFFTRQLAAPIAAATGEVPAD
jgi:cation diffusion facilitator CzcD-associated flavoprotein CzcO